MTVLDVDALQRELDAARRLLWIIADMHGGTVSIAKETVARFDPAGILTVGKTDRESILLQAKRGPGNTIETPPIKYSWDH